MKLKIIFFLFICCRYSKTCLKWPLKANTKKLVFKTDYRLMQVNSIAECSKGSILQYFQPSLSFHLSLRSFLSIFEWPLKTGFTVLKRSVVMSSFEHPADGQDHFNFKLKNFFFVLICGIFPLLIMLSQD